MVGNQFRVSVKWASIVGSSLAVYFSSVYRVAALGFDKAGLRRPHGRRYPGYIPLARQSIYKI